MSEDFYKRPRLYVTAPLKAGNPVFLSSEQSHYLKNVLRQPEGAIVRLFNGEDGEFLGKITGFSKKSGEISTESFLKPQPKPQNRLHLLFAPLKKEALDWLVEKAVELGVTDLHPILTQNADIRKINEDRVRQQIIEAAEQCERLDIPTLHPVQPLSACLANWPQGTPILAALERVEEAAPIVTAVPDKGDIALLVGPAGGFTEEEKAKIAHHAGVRAVSLGGTILRAETAALYAISAVTLRRSGS